MRALQYLLTGCFIWLVSCKEISVPQPNPTSTQNNNTNTNGNTNTNTNPTNTATSWALTTPQGKEAYDEFIKLVFKDSGGRDKNVAKWTDAKPQVLVFLDGSKDPNITKALEGIFAELKAINKVNTFSFTSKAADASIIINRATFEEHNAKYTSAKSPSSGLAGYTTYTFNSMSGITNATIWLNVSLAANNALYILRHEFSHALGLSHTANTNSIMFATANIYYKTASYSALDSKIIEILSDKRIKQGMILKDADPIIKEYLK
ncbi:MAG: DUF2927 domain-containing protein [Spirosomataceae bacterium]